MPPDKALRRGRREVHTGIGNSCGIYLFTPKNGAQAQIVNLAKHDYSLEPNLTFTPDGKRIIFRSTCMDPTCQPSTTRPSNYLWAPA